jgi:hypothetical protein
MGQRSQWFAIALAAIGFGGSTCSCDRNPPAAPVVYTPPTVEIRTVTQLLPTRPTHVAVDVRGNIYWVQETDEGNDLVFVAGDSVVPRATRLSSKDILAAMDTHGGSGNIQSIVVGPSGELYFYFVGAYYRWSRVCVGKYTPGSALIQILSDTTALADTSGMGRSLDLARGDLIASNRQIWLFMRHTDAWAMFAFDPKDLPATGPATLRRPFQQVQIDNVPVNLTRDSIAISAAGDQNLFLTDTGIGELARIDASGNGTILSSLIGLPNLFTPPVAAPGKTDDPPATQPGAPAALMFFARADAIRSKTEAFPESPVKITFPAVLIFRNGGIETLSGDALLAPSGFPVYAMNLQQLYPDKDAGSWIGYDAASGQVLRIKLTR